MGKPLEKTQIVLYALVAFGVLYLIYDFLVIAGVMEPVAWLGDPAYCERAADPAACEDERAYGGITGRLRP